MVLKLDEHDIRDGESSRDYLRRIPLWRQALLLLIGVSAIIVPVFGLAFVFVTAERIIEQLPLWLNLTITASFLVPCAVVSFVTEWPVRWRPPGR